MGQLFYITVYIPVPEISGKEKIKELFSMKKRIAAFLALFCAFAVLHGKEQTFILDPEVQPMVIQKGSPLKIQLRWNAPAGYKPKAWRLVAYVPNVPADFVKATGSKVTANKLKEWSSVFIMNWIWKIPADNILIKETLRWPSGDYKMALYILFESRDKNKKVKNKMIAQNILFTLK